jgi:uncharacterized radical SAM protein YgiQ
MDAVYALPFTAGPTPRYDGQAIPAYTQIKDSITAHRGCFGGCRFCALAYHQGKTIQSRSEGSVLAEVTELTTQPDFRGTVSDIGGPTANMYGMRCKRDASEACTRRSCLWPDVCPHLDTSHAAVRRLLRLASEHPAVRHVFVASGIRFDLALRDPAYIDDIARGHTGGHLKLARNTWPRACWRPWASPPPSCTRSSAKNSRSLGEGRQAAVRAALPHAGAPRRDAGRHRGAGAVAARAEHPGAAGAAVHPHAMTLSTCMYVTGRDFDSGAPSMCRRAVSCA